VEPDWLARGEGSAREGPALIYGPEIPDQISGIGERVVMAIRDGVLLRVRRNASVDGQTLRGRSSPAVSLGIVGETRPATKEAAAPGAGVTLRDGCERPVALLDGVDVLHDAVETTFDHDAVAGRAIVVKYKPTADHAPVRSKHRYIVFCPGSWTVFARKVFQN